MNENSLKCKALRVITAMLIAIALVFSGTASSYAAEKTEDKTPAGYINLCVEKATIGQGYLLEPQKVPFYKGENVAQVLSRTLENNGYEIEYTGDLESSFYLAAVNDKKGSLTATFSKFLQEHFEKNNVNVTNTRESSSLGQFDYTNMSGWVFKTDNRHSPVGASGAMCKDGMVVRWAFTVYGYGSDCWNTGWGNPIIKNDFNRDSLVRVLAEINSNPDKEIILKDSKIKAKYDAMMKAGVDYDMPESQIKDTVLEMEKELPKIENEISKGKEDALNLDKKIDTIGEVTLEKENLIKECRATYDALSEVTKSMVTKYPALQAAETKLEELKAVEKDKAAALALDEKISIIGEVTLEDEALIKECRMAYDALNEKAKSMVTKYPLLQVAEVKLAELKSAIEENNAEANEPSEQSKEDGDKLNDKKEEAKKDKEKKDDVTETGDENPVAILLILMILSALAGTSIYRYNKR